MQEYSIILTLEAIYDIADIADYIEKEFGQHRADRFQSDIKNQLQSLSHSGTIFPKTQLLYRGYFIHKKSFSPSLVFYIIMKKLKKFIFSEYYVMKEIGLIFYRKKQNIHTRNRKEADQSYF